MPRPNDGVHKRAAKLRPALGQQLQGSNHLRIGILIQNGQPCFNQNNINDPHHHHNTTPKLYNSRGISGPALRQPFGPSAKNSVPDRFPRQTSDRSQLGHVNAIYPGRPEHLIGALPEAKTPEDALIFMVISPAKTPPRIRIDRHPGDSPPGIETTPWMTKFVGIRRPAHNNQ